MQKTVRLVNLITAGTNVILKDGRKGTVQRVTGIEPYRKAVVQLSEDPLDVTLAGINDLPGLVSIVGVSAIKKTEAKA